MTFKQVLGSAMAAMMIAGALAMPVKADPGAKKIPNHPRVNQVNGRRENQHDRIQNGIKNGSLTKGETHQVRTEGKDIHAQEHAMRASDKGHLTKQDKTVLNHEQNQRSKQIYKFKHNANNATPGGKNSPTPAAH
ncbi:MAG: hypothetical protein ACYCW6_00775 [Candidatus Xenobia bacterium]